MKLLKYFQSQSVFGEPIALKFNNKGQKCSGKCGRVHVCQVCFSDQHPAYDCPRRRGAAAKKK